VLFGLIALALVANTALLVSLRRMRRLLATGSPQAFRCLRAPAKGYWGLQWVSLSLPICTAGATAFLSGMATGNTDVKIAATLAVSVPTLFVFAIYVTWKSALRAPAATVSIELEPEPTISLESQHT
jgi:hypothetical protein